MKKVLVLLHPGFEEIEAVVPMDLLRRAGVEVISASTASSRRVVGGRGIVLEADSTLEECGNPLYDLLLLPGGPGVADFRKQPKVLTMVRSYVEANRYVAAICAAPLVLLEAGVLKGKKVTAFPGTDKELREHGVLCVEDRVCRDGNLITSRGAGTSEEFALELIRVLEGPEVAEGVRQRIVAR